MKHYLHLEDYKQELFDNYHISELYWADSEVCREMCNFADLIEAKYQTVLDIPFLLMAGKNYMEEVYECLSCPIEQIHFKGFEDFLLSKNKTAQ